MSMSDPIADLLTRIRNASRAEHEKVDIPSSKLKVRLAEILKDEGFIKNYRLIEDKKQGMLRVYLKYGAGNERIISGLVRVSKPGRRVYVAKDKIPTILGGMGGFERKLEIVGIGYRCQLQGKNLQLALGYSHPIIFPLPEGVQAEVERQVSITLKGADKALVGQTAAKLRALRKPDPYKGKGIKYADEYIRRKVGKKAGAK